MTSRNIAFVAGVLLCMLSAPAVPQSSKDWFDQQIPAGCDEYHSETERTTYISWSGRTVFRITDWGPGHSRFAHRTETVDYAILLSGELDLELDEGEAVHLKSGDVVVQRGTVHTWVNRGSIPAITAFILIDAQPVEVGGQVLGTHFPA